MNSEEKSTDIRFMNPETGKLYEKSLKLNPGFTTTHRSLSRITKYTGNNAHLDC